MSPMSGWRGATLPTWTCLVVTLSLWPSSVTPLMQGVSARTHSAARGPQRDLRVAPEQPKIRRPFRFLPTPALPSCPFLASGPPVWLMAKLPSVTLSFNQASHSIAQWTPVP